MSCWLGACAQRGTAEPVPPIYVARPSRVAPKAESSAPSETDDLAGDRDEGDRPARGSARQGASDDDPEDDAADPAQRGKAATRSDKMGADTAREVQECEEQRVSYATPCHDDPDPCDLASGWLGDEYCWPAPPDGKGIQIHIGPKSYDDPDDVATYVIEPGEEFNNSVLGHVPQGGTRWYNRTMVRMRPGSHHWIGTLVAGRPAERFYPEADSNCGSDTVLRAFGGGQNLIYDNPPGGKAAPENEGVGASLPGDSSLCINLHAYNFTERPQLRELWINVYFVDAKDVTQETEAIGIVAGLGLSVPPGANRTLTYRQTFDAPGRIVQLFGHRHMWTPRFAVWLNDELIYDSWSWQESVTFNYDSITQNPAPTPESRTDGAASGTRPVRAGDRLAFSCFIENDSDRTLTWRNELREGEMCNLWGSTIGRGSGIEGYLQ
jgi:hypothetical protein